MYQIEQKDFGIKFVLDGYIEQEEMEGWLAEFKAMADAQTGSFHVFVDMRTLKPLPPAAQESVHNGQKYARENGMVRSVVILQNVVTAMQFKRIAKETGIYVYERYIDAESHPNWEKVALAWLVDGVDPD